MVAELSHKTRTVVAALFDGEGAAAAERILVTRCGNGLPGMSRAAPIELERVWFAALRLSGGHLQKLEEAAMLAEKDWRDLLVAAGFAEDVDVHLHWVPKRDGSEGPEP